MNSAPRRAPARRLLWLLALLPAAGACSPAARATPDPVPATVTATAAPAPPSWARWEGDIRRFEEADRLRPPPAGAVLLVGSSSIRLWETAARDFPGVPIVRRGFGGSELGDVAHFADRIVLPYQPRTVVVYAGDNDLAAGRSAEEVFARYRRLVETIHGRLPEARVLFIAIKPSIARRALMDRMRAANALVRDHASRDPRLVYVDVFTPMLDAGGEPRRELFLEDGLHLNARGYALWTELLSPHLAAVETKN